MAGWTQTGVNSDGTPKYEYVQGNQLSAAGASKYGSLSNDGSTYDTSGWDTDQWSKFGASGGTIGTSGEIIPGSNLSNINPTTGLSSSTSNPWSMQGVGGLALGGVQTGVALLGTLDQMKTAKLQRNLLGQQYDTNAEKMQSWRDNKTAVNKAFGGGLAASGVQ